MSNSSSLLRINVGFVVNQAIGYSREFPFEIPKYSFPDDLHVQNLSGVALVSHTTEGLLVQVKGQAWIHAECVYCLKKFDQQLQFDFVEMYTFPTHANEDTELILPDDMQIDLQPLVREYLHLDFPINPVCSPDCKGLCPVCGENLADANCNHADEVSDPRFDILKTLLDDDAPASS